jgi:ABC-type sugar transport system ATPase subunit
MKEKISVKFQKVHKKFENNTALEETSFQIQTGEFVVFVGPSGCGKTTTLRLIAGLEDVTSGNIFSGEKDITWELPKNRKTAMVFQNYALYPHLSVYENLSYPLDILKFSKAKKKEMILQTAQKLEIQDLLQRKPSELSGGQKQRVAIGRALIRKPEVFLLDEPLSNLDARLRETMRGYIRELHNSLAKTTIYVTHDQQEAMTLADRIFVFSKGKIMQMGTPQEIYQSPKNLYVAKFLGNPPINAFESVASGGFATGDYGKIKISQLGVKKKLPQGKFTFAIRPQHLLIGDKGDFEAKFLYSEYLGTESYYKFQLGGQKILVASDKEFQLKKNSSYFLTLDKKKLFFFDSEGSAI